MIPGRAFELALKVADAGYHCSVNLSNNHSFPSQIDASVAVPVRMMEATEINKLLELGAAYNQVVVLLNSALCFIEDGRPKTEMTANFGYVKDPCLKS